MTEICAYTNSSETAAGGSRTSALLRSGLAQLKPWSDWIVLVLTAAALYPMFGRSSDMGPFYSTAARCILRGEALLTCLPPYPYQPVLAIFFIPLAFLPAVLQRLIWYVIFVGCLVIAVRLTEAIAERLYQARRAGKTCSGCARSCWSHAASTSSTSSLMPLMTRFRSRSSCSRRGRCLTAAKPWADCGSLLLQQYVPRHSFIFPI